MMKWFEKVTLLLAVGIWGNASFANAQQVSVAADGSGQFRTIQAAIASLPDHAAQQRVITIKNGTYREQVFIDGKDHITLRGQSEKGTVLTFALARDAYRCAGNTDDWGVATLNLRNSPDITLENLTIVNSYGFDAQGDVTIDCPTEATGKKTISKTGHQMALRTFPGATRIIARKCTFRALGGDTVSPWDTEAGMYYFKDCTMEGGVDFYCPRGWAYAENVRFICHNKSAAIWHDGSGNKDSKTVLKNCSFEGDDQFKLGRYHRESQFYLIGCKFPQNMADADIYHATSGPGTPAWGRRVYYSGSQRKGGNFAWMKDNLASAEGAPTAKQITAAWTFGGRWNPEGKGSAVATKAPVVTDSIAEKMLVYQRSIGGWPKAVGEVKVDYDAKLTAAKRASTLADANRKDATIDNNATTREIKYLISAFKRTNNPAYRTAAENGIRYLLKMQLKSGGFPQFYPDSSNYRGQITYNDNAMVRALWLLKAVAEQEKDYALIDFALVPQAKAAVQRGIGCILKTQYVQNGKLTAWCAQHDRRTLQPIKARAFEVASLSGMETVGILEFLMAVENPTPEIKRAIEAGVAWLDAVKMPGYAMKNIEDPAQPTGRDRIVVPEAGSTLWARFYDLETNKPIYVGRDGVKHAQLADIENERRAGYVYASNWPAKLLATEYPKWQKKWENGKSGL
ncbi:pectate lyase [Hymenobacter koreensis]|uniref:Pectinesterase catalytic domain-containing protein n=1 Tax=Hymenobacter koreensis TaxID=1084523 RepID=A0ABP8IZ59_9BACT